MAHRVNLPGRVRRSLRRRMRDRVLPGIVLGRSAVPDQPTSGPVTAALWERLTTEDRAAIEAALEGDTATLWAQAVPAARPRLALQFAAHYALPGALQRTGLRAAMPPEDVHAMARGPLAAGGDLGTADLVADALDAAGVALAEGATLLDFGCSSGRALRALAAWRPDLEAIGCDPNAPAIAWAAEHLAPARFFTSPLAPPLPLPDASVDVAYAISIWSHFAAAPALAWLTELHRVVRPGGALLITVHGFDALGSFRRSGIMDDHVLAFAAEGVLRDGHVFWDIWRDRPEGDWGVKDPGWGNAYLSADWLLAHVTPAWAVRLYRPGALLGTQDVVVLERRG